jgi:putative nucleotidyltransferase with HDIG domain
VQELELVAELRRLPLQPSSVTRVLAVLDDPACGAADVAQAIAPDVGLCARVLRLANSPYFGTSGRVASLDRAVVTVGHSVVRSLAITTAAGLLGDPSRVPDGFWGHSGAVAVASSLVARRWRLPASEALCAGLLHDLGAALAYRHDPDTYAAVVAAGPRALLDAERGRYGAHHGELGAMALAAWRLPAPIVDAVRAHHDGFPAGPRSLQHVVVAGEALVRAVLGDGLGVAVEPYEGAPDDDGDDPATEEPASDADAADDLLARVGLGPADVDALKAHIDEDGDAPGAWLIAA